MTSGPAIDLDAAIRRLVERHETITAVAASLGVGRNALKYLLRLAGVDIRARRDAWLREAAGGATPGTAPESAAVWRRAGWPLTMHPTSRRTQLLRLGLWRLGGAAKGNNRVSAAEEARRLRAVEAGILAGKTMTQIAEDLGLGQGANAGLVLSQFVRRRRGGSGVIAMRRRLHREALLRGLGGRDAYAAGDVAALISRYDFLPRRRECVPAALRRLGVPYRAQCYTTHPPCVTDGSYRNTALGGCLGCTRCDQLRARANKYRRLSRRRAAAAAAADRRRVAAWGADADRICGPRP